MMVCLITNDISRLRERVVFLMFYAHSNRNPAKLGVLASKRDQKTSSAINYCMQKEQYVIQRLICCDLTCTATIRYPMSYDVISVSHSAQTKRQEQAIIYKRVPVETSCFLHFVSLSQLNLAKFRGSANRFWNMSFVYQMAISCWDLVRYMAAQKPLQRQLQQEHSRIIL